MLPFLKDMESGYPFLGIMNVGRYLEEGMGEHLWGGGTPAKENEHKGACLKGQKSLEHQVTWVENKKNFLPGSMNAWSDAAI